MIFLKDYQVKVVQELEQTFSVAHAKKTEIETALNAIPEHLRASIPSMLDERDRKCRFSCDAE